MTPAMMSTTRKTEWEHWQEWRQQHQRRQSFQPLHQGDQTCSPKKGPSHQDFMIQDRGKVSMTLHIKSHEQSQGACIPIAQYPSTSYSNCHNKHRQLQHPRRRSQNTQSTFSHKTHLPFLSQEFSPYQNKFHNQYQVREISSIFHNSLIFKTFLYSKYNISHTRPLPNMSQVQQTPTSPASSFSILNHIVDLLGPDGRYIKTRFDFIEFVTTYPHVKVGLVAQFYHDHVTPSTTIQQYALSLLPSSGVPSNCWQN